jgi:hypothetical protein
LKKHLRLTIALIGILAIAMVSYFWTNGLITSLVNYRSPLHFSPPQPGPPLGKPITRRVIIVLIDGLRLDTAADNYVMPYLNYLRPKGASATMHSRPPSFSQPGYATILTGAWPDLNDSPVVNLEGASDVVPTQDDIFSAAHRAGLQTAISAYYWFEKLIPYGMVNESYYTQGIDAAADADVMAAAIPMLSGDYQLMLIHLDQVDYAGHFQGGPLATGWVSAAGKTDEYVREIVSALDFTQDTIIVLSDHGQIDRGGHGGPEAVTLTEPFLMVGAGVRAGVYPDIQQADVAPTVAALLGINIPASSQGIIQTRMLNISVDYNATLLVRETNQKKNLYKAYITAIKSIPDLSLEPTTPLSYIMAMNVARTDRLARERVWRSMLSLILGILPVCALFLLREKRVIWLTTGALVYVFIFNFSYLIFDGGTYSLSSITSEASFIRFIGITEAISMIAGWMVAMLRLHVFTDQPLSAMETSLGFMFMTFYLLALPVLINFAINGPDVSWTLPEFYSLFVAFFSLIQLRFLVIISVLLAVATALIARYVPHPVMKHRRSRWK